MGIKTFRISVPTIEDRNWQAKCIFLLIAEHYKEDLEYTLEAPLGISAFDNGRERGYTLKYKGLEISFAEGRSSDDIVVYPFVWDNPNEKDQENDYEQKTRRFKYQQFYKTFEFILKYLGIRL
jgi:hypothetical protein